MAWNDLASNQIPTFTDLQTSGFTLNAGQSAVTSNECLTKTEALAKYNLSTSLMSSYASNQLVPKSNYASGSVNSYAFELERYGYSTALESCSGTNSTVTWYSSVSYLAIGQTLYFEAALINPRNGGNQWHKDYVNNRTCKIDTNGIIIDIQSCPGNAFTFGTIGSSTSSGACSVANTGLTLYSSSTSLSIGTVLYSDLYLTNLFIPGEDVAFYHSGSNAYFINPYDGVISSITACVPENTREQILNQYNDPCGILITDLWYDFVSDLYYTSETGSTLYSGGGYVYVGPDPSFGHVWSEYAYTSGVQTFIGDINSTCSPS
jgi:hypothetical protein